MDYETTFEDLFSLIVLHIKIFIRVRFHIQLEQAGVHATQACKAFGVVRDNWYQPYDDPINEFPVSPQNYLFLHEFIVAAWNSEYLQQDSASSYECRLLQLLHSWLDERAPTMEILHLCNSKPSKFSDNQDFWCLHGRTTNDRKNCIALHHIDFCMQSIMSHFNQRTWQENVKKKDLTLITLWKGGKTHRGMIIGHYNRLLRNSAKIWSRYVKMRATYGTLEFL